MIPLENHLTHGEVDKSELNFEDLRRNLRRHLETQVNDMFGAWGNDIGLTLSFAAPGVQDEISEGKDGSDVNK